MNRHEPVPRPAARRPALAVLLLALAGCTHNLVPTERAQRGEDGDHDRYGVKTVGDVCTFSNADPVPVSGIGLVEGLDGTGSPAPPGAYRQALEQDLLKQRVPDV